MVRCLVLLTLVLSAESCFAEDAMCRLPKPHYHPQPSDPQWLTQAVQFHGHLGPWAVAGLRAGMAGRSAVDADGYFDVDVAAKGPFVAPPRSCFLDGLQVSTGATLGKRNLSWTEADEVVVIVRNTRSGKAAKVVPTAKLMKLLSSFKPQPKTAAGQRADLGDDHDRADQVLEALARKIAAGAQKDLFTVTDPGQ